MIKHTIVERYVCRKRVTDCKCFPDCFTCAEKSELNLIENHYTGDSSGIQVVQAKLRPWTIGQALTVAVNGMEI